MNPFISVIVPTMRVGGLDILFESLRQQSFKDFELVLADGLFEYRHELVAAKSVEYGLSVTHLEPFDNPFPTTAYCRYANTAISRAKGDILLFVVDYTWLPRGLIEAHANFHAKHNRSFGLMCPHDYYELPAISDKFKPYGTADIERYRTDIQYGKLEDMMWSITSDPFMPEQITTQDLPDYSGADPKLREDIHKIPFGDRPSYFHCKNESVARAAVLEANGFDESMDGTNCLDPSTPILYADMTWRKIGEAKSGDRIVGFDEFSPGRTFRRYREATIEAVAVSNKQAFKITTETGKEIVSTSDHRWLVRKRGAWTWRNNLQVGDQLLLAIDPSGFFQEDEEFMMGYIGGMTAGDGTVIFPDNGKSRDTKGKQIYWRVALADLEPLERIKRYLQHFGVTVEIKSFDGGPKSKSVFNKVESRAVSVLEKIRNLVEERVHSVQYWRGFMSGFFDAEGNDGTSLVLTQNPGSTLDYAKNISSMMGFLFRDSSPKISGGINTRLIGEIYERMRFYTETNPSLSRKKRWWIDKTMVSRKEKIVSIEPTGLTDVVDIQTSTSTFIANGFATHNCYQDMDIAYRLAKRCGIVWQIQTTPVAVIVNPRRIFPFPVRLRPIESNYAIFMKNKQNGFPIPNAWRLRDDRVTAQRFGSDLHK